MKQNMKIFRKREWKQLNGLAVHCDAITRGKLNGAHQRIVTLQRFSYLRKKGKKSRTRKQHYGKTWLCQRKRSKEISLHPLRVTIVSVNCESKQLRVLVNCNTKGWFLNRGLNRQLNFGQIEINCFCFRHSNAA
ncbi:uncharacterized protein LOC105663497 isoform X2 [Megachile rotundata]|uniref:uncharacterized protein LOC105663497 isoform X2 n=1 Tax=Megachile rotundata TaxID=143995 RepID=UPI0006150EA9|nr:PREDICTED: uncharacterized protein LOC105663497 [Megachile rotundata]